MGLPRPPAAPSACPSTTGDPDPPAHHDRAGSRRPSWRWWRMGGSTPLPLRTGRHADEPWAGRRRGHPRHADPVRSSTSGLRVSGTADRGLRAVTFRLGSNGRGAQIAAVTWRQGRMSGNRFGNPGAPTRRYGTALDEMGPHLSSVDGPGRPTRPTRSSASPRSRLPRSSPCMAPASPGACCRPTASPSSRPGGCPTCCRPCRPSLGPSGWPGWPTEPDGGSTPPPDRRHPSALERDCSRGLPWATACCA
jgi:hypothetical protein